MLHTSTELVLAGSMVLLSVAVARADCAGEFGDINRIKSTAGPYEIATTLSITYPSGTHQGSQTAQAVHAVQVVPPQSFRIRTRSAEVVVIGNGKGWASGGGPWVEVTKEKMADLLEDAPLSGYFAIKGQSDLQCQGVQNIDGMPYLTFVYTIAGAANARGPQTTRITAYFDPVTRLPIGGQSLTDVMGARMHAEMVYRFDPSIKIDPPNP
ncbi:MAG: hypothetical protein J0H97_20170 [Alphaproteobacteria bacterium]|jgi:hypothetical protein|nr:hypothetical protein [Alphaproteobacteria bacterium]